MGTKCLVSIIVSEMEIRGTQDERGFVSEMLRVGKEGMRQNPCASCSASPCFHSLPDLSLAALPDVFVLVSLLHALCICSVGLYVLLPSPLLPQAAAMAVNLYSQCSPGACFLVEM